MISLNRTQILHYSKNSGKNCDYSAPYQAIPGKIMTMTSFKVSSILHTKFCTISCNRIRDTAITRIKKKERILLPIELYMYT